MFFVLRNLSAIAAEPVEAPWTLKTSVPEFASKEEYREWAKNPTTSHAFVSPVEGLSSVIRVGKDNPPVKMHGLVVDYDNHTTTTDRLRDLALRRGVVTLQDVEDGEVEGVELQRIGGRHMGAKIA